MHAITPTPTKKHTGRKGIFAIAGVVVLAVGYVSTMLTLPLPQPQLTLEVHGGPVSTGVPELIWPTANQIAIGANGYGQLAANGPDTPAPIASVAKVITAIAVLRQKPLDVNQSGPTLTFTADDVAIYNQAVAVNGSVVRVKAGESMSEYQALQGLLLPSGNNLATTLARWAFGSDEAYLKYANKMVADMGMSKTHVADASGFSPSTVSSARDLLLLAQETFKYPVITQIVNQKQATLPNVGTVTNVNSTLGISDINGIKTGNTEQAGGCLLFSATRAVAGHEITFVGAIVGAADLSAALAAAPRLVESNYPNFTRVQPLRAGQTVASVHVPWAASQPVVAERAISQVVWKGAPLQLKIDAKADISGTLGKAALGDSSTALQLKETIDPPDMWWRLTHPDQMLQSLFMRAPQP